MILYTSNFFQNLCNHDYLMSLKKKYYSCQTSGYVRIVHVCRQSACIFDFLFISVSE